MSFSSKVKAELLSHISTGRHCRMAELAAMIAMSGEYRDGVWTMDAGKTRSYRRKSRSLLHFWMWILTHQRADRC